MQRISTLALLTSLAVCSAQTTVETKRVSRAAALPVGVEVLHAVEIGTGGGRTLRAEIARPTRAPSSPLPAVLWIHGGGWSGGSHLDNRALDLAARGYFTASIEYRLTGEAPWPAQIEDCKLGVRWLRANAARYHVNPDRIGVWGASAGGHLVACLGTMGDEAQFEGLGGYPGVSSRVRAVVDFCGPSDFTGHATSEPGGFSADPPALLALFGVPSTKNPERWAAASPIRHVSDDDAAFLFVHGDRDSMVPIEQSQKLARDLKQAGVPVEFITVKGGGHNMAAAPGQPPALPDRKTLDAAVLKFFDRQLKK